MGEYDYGELVVYNGEFSDGKPLCYAREDSEDGERSLVPKGTVCVVISGKAASDDGEFTGYNGERCVSLREGTEPYSPDRKDWIDHPKIYVERNDQDVGDHDDYRIPVKCLEPYVPETTDYVSLFAEEFRRRLTNQATKLAERMARVTAQMP